MDGVVIHMSADGAGALIWCEDQGPLGLVRREDLLAGVDRPLAVGDSVQFDILEEGELRICAGLTRNAAPPRAELPALLRRTAAPRPKGASLTLVHSAEPRAAALPEPQLCV